jgi:hypothetical protein
MNIDISDNFYNCDINKNIKKMCRKEIISMIINNAKNLGWTVEREKNNKNVYILKKKIDKLTKYEKNTDTLIDMIFDIRNF